MVNRRLAVIAVVAAISLGFLASIAPGVITSPPATVVGAPAGSAPDPDPSWTRISPLTITNNAELAAAASSGAGTVGDPYIIENFLIECNYSSHGIILQATTAHAIIRNGYINESWDNPASATGLGIAAGSNIRVDNVTVAQPIATGFFVGMGASSITLANIDVRDVPAAQYGIQIDQAAGVTVANLTASNATAINLRALLGATTGITIDNITIENNTALEVSGGGSGITNVTVSNSMLRNSSMTIGSIDEFTITGNTFTNCTIFFSATSDHANVTVTNNTFTDAGGWGGIYFSSPVNDTLSIENNTFVAGVGTDHHVYIAVGGDDITITGNTFNGSVVNYVIEAGSEDYYRNNYTITGNSFNDIASTYHDVITDNIIALVGGGANRIYSAVVTGNWFNNCTRLAVLASHPATLNQTVTVTGNWFNNVGPMWMPGAGATATLTWESNYYRAFFDTFPYALTVNVSTDVLEHEHVINATLNDTAPRYWPAWYPRAETVNVRFYSNVNGDGILFDHLRVLLDSVQVASPALTPGDLLFRLTVSDYEGRLLHDEVHNLNTTGEHLNIGLDTTAQVHFAFYSSLDYFGLDFSLVRLYIDGVRITTPSPAMRPRVIDVVVRDYASVLIYAATLNLSTTGVYVDIALPIAAITVTNNYNRTVIWHLIRGTVSTTYALGPGMQLALRLALGSYSYILTETNGDEIAAADLTFRADRPAEFAISFGWTSTTPGDITIYQTQLLDYLMMVMLFGVIAGAVVFIAWRVRDAPAGSGGGGSKRSSGGKKDRRAPSSWVTVFRGW